MADNFTQPSNYESLKTEVQSYLNRNDSSTIASIPLFINNAEKSLKRQLRMPSMEKTIELAYEDMEGEDWFYLPEDYIEMKNFWYTEGDHSEHLYPVDMVQLVRLSGDDCPASYARSGVRIYVRPTGTEDTVFTMTYYVDLPETGSYIYDDDTGEIVGQVETSVIYDLAHDVWVYMAAAEGFRFLYEPEKAEYWSSLGEKRLREIKDMLQDAEYSGGVIVVGASAPYA